MPRLGIVVEIDEAYGQCPKALIRSDLWNPGTQGTWQLLRSRVQDVLCLAFSPEGTLLASAGQDRSVKIWDVGPAPAAFPPPRHEP